MSVEQRSVYERTDSSGYRVLATRYWPRGVRRDAVDEYVPAPAPSKACCTISDAAKPAGRPFAQGATTRGGSRKRSASWSAFERWRKDRR